MTARIKGAIAASELEIKSFEKAHGIQLPLTYREFMRHQGGGTPQPNCFLDRERGRYLYVASVFPLNDPRMAEQRFAFPPPRETGFLAIGASGGGDYFLIDLEEGEVFYWDHEHDSVDLDPQELARLADSLASFVDALANAPCEVLEVPDEIEVLGRDGSIEEVSLFARTRGLHAKSTAGRSVAEEAARHGNLAVVKRCCELGAPMKNLLHFAASGRNTDLVRYLLDAGAGINDLNDLGQTPLDRAMIGEVYELLERSGGTHAKRSKPPHLH